MNDQEWLDARPFALEDLKEVIKAALREYEEEQQRITFAEENMTWAEVLRRNDPYQ